MWMCSGHDAFRARGGGQGWGGRGQHHQQVVAPGIVRLFQHKPSGGVASPSLGLKIFQECPWTWRRWISSGPRVTSMSGSASVISRAHLWALNDLTSQGFAFSRGRPCSCPLVPSVGLALGGGSAPGVSTREGLGRVSHGIPGSVLCWPPSLSGTGYRGTWCLVLMLSLLFILWLCGPSQTVSPLCASVFLPGDQKAHLGEN